MGEYLRILVLIFFSERIYLFSTFKCSLREIIFCLFSDNFGLFRSVSKQFCLFRLFRYRFETPKQTKIIIFWFHETNRNKPETDLVSVCFGSNRQNIFFISRTPYLSITNNEIKQNSKSKPKKFSILCTFNALNTVIFAGQPAQYVSGCTYGTYSMTIAQYKYV